MSSITLGSTGEFSGRLRFLEATGGGAAEEQMTTLYQFFNGI
jgi:hypothetical protein